MTSKKISKILWLLPLFIVVVFSCEEDWIVDCNDCYSFEPDSADLIVELTINAENPEVPLVFYRGKIEDNVIEWVDTSRVEVLYLYSPVEEYYSVKAFYKTGEETIIAVDGDKLKTREVTESCDYTCWVIRGGRLDVRLKESE